MKTVLPPAIVQSRTLRGTVYRLPKADAMQSLKNGMMVILFGVMICLFMFTSIAVPLSSLPEAGVFRWIVIGFACLGSKRKSLEVPGSYPRSIILPLATLPYGRAEEIRLSAPGNPGIEVTEVYKEIL